jgi:hypothetical protein
MIASASGRDPAPARSGVVSIPTSKTVTGSLPRHSGNSVGVAVGVDERIVVGGTLGRGALVTGADGRGAGVTKMS